MAGTAARTQGLSRNAVGRVVPSLRRRSASRLEDADPVTGWVATAAVTLLALFLRLWHLGTPAAFSFDETYYAKDAWSLLHFGYARNYVANANDQILDGNLHGLWSSGPEMIVHPEVGKWLIASGEAVFGMNPFGWRFASAIVGSLMVMVMVRLARRMTGSTVLGVAGGLIMCLDGLQLVLSRLALLDIFQAFFVLCAVSCLVADRDWGRARLARLAPAGASPSSWGPRLLWRPWRVAAGLMWGLGLGCKWGTLYVMLGFGLLVWAWDAGARRRLGVDLSVWKAAVVDALAAFGWLVVLPVLVYVATWTGWLMNYHVYEANLSRTQYGPYWGTYVTQKLPDGFFANLARGLRSLWHYHVSVYDFHTGGLTTAHHVYQSNPGGWLVLNRPVGVDAQLDIKPGEQGCTAPADSTCLRQVLLLGNPAVWWAGTCAAIYACLAWVARRDWRYGVVVVGVLTSWLPWFRYDDRPIFSYYAIVTEPFLVLGLVLVLGRIWGSLSDSPRRRRYGVLVAGAYVVLVALAFAWFWPIWTDQLITTPHWLQRVWFHRWI
ncbi:dolichyl-phosphate-mannose--protein mannosyltransferase [Nocardioides mangrovicus]|uniref:dolichyl-phosphate-mannose--protein mannosyltransferase n=1 Tax=Nocardioides mangrovicus TaxID=2478913 RepID=UPI001E5E2242|nr:phospholipid carrier-dependent glycosyltransferase [Nocardioides mangrovicus]